MKLYKFRPLVDSKDLKEIKKIIDKGFCCCDFLKFNDMNEGVFSIKLQNINIELSEKLKYRICSFSGKKALNSQLMWGHYANAGMGVAIEVEVDDYLHIKKVVYSDNCNELDSTEEILTHKTTEWQYENEFRYIKNIENASKDEIIKKIGKITKIYFGTPYEGLTNYKEIEKEHKKLKEYLEYKQKLKDHFKDIPCEDYEFNF